MATLGNPKNTIEIIQKYGFNFQKKFGQNFLIDTHVLQRRTVFWKSVPVSVL